MGRRAQRGPGTAQKMKLRQLGAELSGLTKPQLDALNAESKRQHRLGVGVLVQEEERATRVVESLRAERERLAFWQWSERWRIRMALRRAEPEMMLWKNRLLSVTREVAANASARDVDRFRRRR